MMKVKVQRRLTTIKIAKEIKNLRRDCNRDIDWLKLLLEYCYGEESSERVQDQ